MNKGYKAEKTGAVKKSVITGVAVGYITAVILLLLIAAIMYKADVSERMYPIAATVLLSLSSLAGGITAGIISRTKVLISGALSGAFFFLPIALVSVAVTKSGPTGLLFIRFLLSVLTASAGSVLTALKKESKISI